MVLGVLNQAFDVLVLRYGVQKRVYCNVSTTGRRGQVAEGICYDVSAGTSWLLSRALPHPQTHQAVSTALSVFTCVSPPASAGVPSVFAWHRGRGLAQGQPLIDTQAWRMGAQAGVAVLTCPGEYKPWW